jgi:outer membrane protein assembly factor BamE (lipoprotein component of BamABCDE complex)
LQPRQAPERCEQLTKLHLKMKKPIIIFIVLISIIVCGIEVSKNISEKKFDSQNWKTTKMNAEDDCSLRWDMMNSLRNNYKLVGMSKSEILNLLGKPDENFTSENTFRYYLGYSHSGIDTGSLIIEFENGIVKSFLVWEG